MNDSEHLDHDRRKSGQQRLWLCVVRQAIEDATRSANHQRLHIRMEVLRAREWLTQPSEDFETVCSLSGIEPDQVRAFAINEIAKADAKERRRPGVGQNFSKELGTGGGRNAQDRAEIEFSQNAELQPCQ